MSNISTPILQFDEEHYWELVTFVVEGHLFRVPRHNFIEHSKTFTLQYLVTRDPGRKSGAHLDDDPLSNAIELDVSVDDFRCFLKALYPRRSKGLLKDEWLSVLKLSHEWSFRAYRDMAIEALTPYMDPTEKLVKGKEYAIAAWVRLGLAEFVTRAGGISQDEAETIGWRNAIDLFIIREARFASVVNQKSSRRAFDVEEAIAVAFASDLSAVHDQESSYLEQEETSLADNATLKAIALEEHLKQQEWILSQGKLALQALKDGSSAAATTSTRSTSSRCSPLPVASRPTPALIEAARPTVKLEEDTITLRVSQHLSSEPSTSSVKPPLPSVPAPSAPAAANPTAAGAKGLAFSPPNPLPKYALPNTTASFSELVEALGKPAPRAAAPFPQSSTT